MRGWGIRGLACGDVRKGRLALRMCRGLAMAFGDDTHRAWYSYYGVYGLLICGDCWSYEQGQQLTSGKKFNL